MEKKISSILLIGPQGVGKTTLIKKLAHIFKENQIKCIGFYTEEVRSENGFRTGYDVVDINGTNETLARKNPLDKIQQRPTCGKYSVYVKEFEKIALPMLKIDPKTVLLIDEIGKMELVSKSFQQRLDEIFGKTIILATIQSRDTIDLFLKYKNHESSLLFEISKTNRNRIIEEIFQIATELLGVGGNKRK